MTHQMELGVSPVKLKTSWYELLGDTGNTFPAKERRQRWETWKGLARENGDDDVVEYWSDASGCQGCIHADGDWCTAVQLPCAINPLLTMRHGMIGMACAGTGHSANAGAVAPPPQMPDSTNDAPGG